MRDGWREGGREVREGEQRGEVRGREICERERKQKHGKEREKRDGIGRGGGR